MKKQFNEAQVRIDLSGLESDDLDTLSRMLALAGQAETQVTSSTVPAMAPLDIDSIGGEDTPSIMPQDGVAPDLGDAAEELAGSVTDFGADGEESEENFEMGLDMDGHPSVESTSSADDLASTVGDDDISLEVDSDYDDSFDMDRMSSLAGIHESVEDEDGSDDEESDEDDAEELDESLLPDLSLDEDSVASAAHEEHGPFANELECVTNAKHETNGYEGENFIVVPKGNRFYWKRTMQEDVLRPEAEFVDTDGIENSRHGIKHKRTALGDNPLLSPVCEEDETLEDIKESISAKFKKFMGGDDVQL